MDSKSAGRTVAVMGVGIMGKSIARHLLQAGWQVHCFDPQADAVAALVAEGAVAIKALDQLPPHIGLVLTSLPSAAALHATVLALQDLPVQAPPRVLADLSTLSLADKLAAHDSLRAAGIGMLDCPISGTGAQAVQRDLSVYVSGEQAHWERHRAAFEAFAARPVFVGRFGDGSRMKYIANLLVAIHNVASAEAMALAERAGLNAQQTIALLSAGAGSSRIFELRAPLMASGRYEPATMKLDVWDKDMAVIGQFIDQLGADCPLFEATRPVYDLARQQRPQADTAAVFEVLRKHAGD